MANLYQTFNTIMSNFRGSERRAPRATKGYLKKMMKNDLNCDKKKTIEGVKVNCY